MERLSAGTTGRGTLRRLLAAFALPLIAVIGLACGGDDPEPVSGTPAPPQAIATPTSEAAEPTPPPTTTAAVEPSPTAAPPEPSATPASAESVPIVDLHFHPELGWAAVLPALFDELGVQAAGNGASDSDEPVLDLAARFPGRVIAFGGGPDVRRLVLAHGEAAWQLQAPEMEDFLARLESLLAEGRLQGIGELHVDNQASNIIGSPQYRFPADSPLMQRVFALSARYGVPVSVHLDADPDSVAEMERLLEANRDGTWLWAHCGHYAEPELIRRLLAAHPNLHCELSYRVAIMPSRTAIPLDAGGVVKEDWRALLGEHSDRFVIGTDLGAVSPESYAAVIRYWRNILGQLSPEAVARIAHLNAERLLSGGE